MGDERQSQEGLPPIGCIRSAETVVATRKKSWRLDGHKLDRQRDWLGVSKAQPISSARLVLPAGRRGRVGREQAADHPTRSQAERTGREGPPPAEFYCRSIRCSAGSARARVRVALPPDRDITRPRQASSQPASRRASSSEHSHHLRMVPSGLRTRTSPRFSTCAAGQVLSGIEPLSQRSGRRQSRSGCSRRALSVTGETVNMLVRADVKPCNATERLRGAAVARAAGGRGTCLTVSADSE